MLKQQISYYFPDKTMWKSFVCASVAAVILKALDPFRTGETALYHVKYDTEWHAFEFGPFVLMGIIGVGRKYTSLTLTHLPLLTNRAGYLWRAVHQTEHETGPMEEIIQPRTRTRHAGCHCRHSNSPRQLSQPVHACSKFGARVEPLCRVLHNRRRSIRPLQNRRRLSKHHRAAPLSRRPRFSPRQPHLRPADPRRYHPPLHGHRRPLRPRNRHHHGNMGL